MKSFRFTNRDRCLDPISKVVFDVFVDIRASEVRWIISLNDGRHSLLTDCDAVEGVSASSCLVLVYVLEAVNVHAQYPSLVIPRLNDFVVDPFSPSSPAPNQDNRAGLAHHLIAYPLLYSRFTALCDSFPAIIRCGRISFDNSHIPDLRRTPAIWLVMETVECPASHIRSNLRRRNSPGYKSISKHLSITHWRKSAGVMEWEAGGVTFAVY